MGGEEHLRLFDMNMTKGRNVVVVGTQWGDEGKGKLVDWLTESAQGVVRFQGGHNAGHTLVIGGKNNKESAQSLKKVIEDMNAASEKNAAKK